MLKEYESSLPRSQKPSDGPYPNPDKSILMLYISCIMFIIIGNHQNNVQCTKLHCSANIPAHWTSCSANIPAHWTSCSANIPARWTSCSANIPAHWTSCLWPPGMSIKLRVKTGIPEDGADERRNASGY